MIRREFQAALDAWKQAFAARGPEGALGGEFDWLCEVAYAVREGDYSEIPLRMADRSPRTDAELDLACAVQRFVWAISSWRGAAGNAAGRDAEAREFGDALKALVIAAGVPASLLTAAGDA